MKQTAVAKRGGLDADKLSKLATGANTNPRWETIVKVAKGFGVEPSAFLAGPAVQPPAVNHLAPETTPVDKDRPSWVETNEAMGAAHEAAQRAVDLAGALTKELAIVRAQLRRCESRKP